MCFRMVSALRPWAIWFFAMCCAYQTSDMFGRLILRDRYSFCQLLYMAWVFFLLASRRALTGSRCILFCSAADSGGTAAGLIVRLGALISVRARTKRASASALARALIFSSRNRLAPSLYN